MRRRQLLASGMFAATGLSAGELLRAAPAAAETAPLKSVGVQLPVDDLRAIELDEARGRLYIAQGVGGGLPLVVTDLDGRLLIRVTAVVTFPTSSSATTGSSCTRPRASTGSSR